MLLLGELEAEMRAKMLRAMLQAMLQVILVEMVPCFGLDCLVLDCFLQHSVLRIQMIHRDFHHSHFLRFGCYQSFREKCL